MSVNCKKWNVALIKKLWDVAWDLWKHHNGIIHEVENVVTGAKLRQLKRNVCDIYQQLQQLQLAAHNRYLLLTKLSRLLKRIKYTRRPGCPTDNLGKNFSEGCNVACINT